jgi:hypothetical protein
MPDLDADKVQVVNEDMEILKDNQLFFRGAAYSGASCSCIVCCNVKPVLNMHCLI